MTYAYIRFSSSHQDELQQKFALDEFAKQKGITIDAFEKDEGISGGVSYKYRNLYKLVKKMEPGDTLITTEISRLGRSMGDLNMLVTQELKPRKLRLIVTKMGLDLDCSNLKAMDEMIIFAFGFSAQIEKEMIVQRTQSAIDARKDAIKRDGGFISKKGLWTKKLGRPKGADLSTARAASALSHFKAAETWRQKSPLYSMVKREIKRGTSATEILKISSELYDENPTIYCTREGKKLCAGTLSRWRKELRYGI